MELYLRYALELAVVLPAAVLAFLPVRDRFRFRAGAVYAAAGVSLFVFITLGAWLCAQNRWNSNRIAAPCLLLFLALYLGAVRLEASKKHFCFFTAAMLAGWCSMYTTFLAAPLETDGEPFAFASSAICLGITIVVGAVFWKTLTERLPYLFEVERLERAWRQFTLIPLALAALNYWMTPLHPPMVLLGRTRRIALVIMLIVPSVFFAFCYLLWWLTKSLTESARLQDENNLLQIEQKRYEALRDYMDETRAMRHDFRQHLAVVEQLHRAGDDENLTAYLHQLHAAVDAKSRRYCANLTVDAIAAHYDALASEQDTVIEWTLSLSDTLPVTNAEFCALLGNLAENALHAVAELPVERRRVKIGAEQRSSILTLCVDNPYAGTLRLGRNGLPRANRSGHGVGLASVAATVRRCDGTMELSTEGGVFSVDIVLYARRSKEERH